MQKKASATVHRVEFGRQARAHLGEVMKQDERGTARRNTPMPFDPT